MYEIYHHGVKGMKWGVRRFQKKDGSLTSEGKARLKKSIDDRYQREDGKLTSKGKNKLQSDIDKASEVGGKAIEKAKAVNDSRTKKANSAKIKDDLSNLSDQELQKIVNRLNMEERYKQVMNSRAAEEGQNRVGKILEYAGTALTVGASAATLILKMQELKNK